MHVLPWKSCPIIHNIFSSTGKTRFHSSNLSILDLCSITDGRLDHSEQPQKVVHKSKQFPKISCRPKWLFTSGVREIKKSKRSSLSRWLLPASSSSQRTLSFLKLCMQLQNYFFWVSLYISSFSKAGEYPRQVFCSKEKLIF